MLKPPSVSSKILSKPRNASSCSLVSTLKVFDHVPPRMAAELEHQILSINAIRVVLQVDLTKRIDGAAGVTSIVHSLVMGGFSGSQRRARRKWKMHYMIPARHIGV